MTKDITKYINSCPKCKTSKSTLKIKEPMILTPTPIRALDTMLIYTVGPLSKSVNGNEYIVTFICDLTKYFISVPTTDKSARSVANAIMENCILIYGPMKKVLTDMGTEYMNQLYKGLC